MLKKRLVAVIALALTSVIPFAASNVSEEVRSDVQLRAMLDELARSKTLQLNNLDKPYFIEYAVSDSEQINAQASLGGITSSTRVRVRQPQMRVRVGDYKFDNANSTFAITPRLGLFPTDDDYTAMRTDLWLSTDGLYKAATDEITRKRAALREIADPDKTPDLAPAKPVIHLKKPPSLEVDQKEWEQLARLLSARFVAHPGVMRSQVRIRAISSTYRLANSEGTVVRIPQELSDVEIRASGFAPDGIQVWNHIFVTALRPSELPGAEQLSKLTDGVAAETEALTKAPMGDEYTGPVLFEQEAAAEMMAQVLTDALRLERKPITQPGSDQTGARQGPESVWASRLGSKVAPDWITILDNPKEDKFHGTILTGQYAVDDEGVPAERVVLVEKGTLKSFLLSREPVREFNASNGHGRLPGRYGSEQAVIGNLFVQADQSISEAQLKAKLIEKAKASGLKYGILIRRIDFPSTANLDELQNMVRQLQSSGYTRTLSAPLLAYRVYLDGREELVRGMRFKEFSAKDLRDLEAASDHPYVLNYLNNGLSLNLADLAANTTTSAIVCPSLLFDSVDLARADEQRGNRPVVAAPALEAQSQ